MKIFTKLRVAITAALLIGGMASVWGQQLGTTGLYKHGTNSHSPAVDVGYESKDSVTVGSVMDYFVMPDPLASPLYDVSSSFTNNLNTNFTWSHTGPAAPTIATKATFGENYVTVQWPTGAAAIGSYTLKAVESNGAGCVDAGGTTIDVVVINAPSAGFSSVTNTECTSDPATKTYNLPLNRSTDVNNNRLTVTFSVVYTPIDGTAGAPATYTEVIPETGNVELSDIIGALNYGSYEVTITDVDDRISVKSNKIGTIGATGTFTYNLIRLPQTGKIYHLPNN